MKQFIEMNDGERAVQLGHSGVYVYEDQISDHHGIIHIYKNKEWVVSEPYGNFGGDEVYEYPTEDQLIKLGESDE